MKNGLKNRSKDKTVIYIKAFALETAITAIFIFLFALIIFLTDNGLEYSAVFATAAVASGVLTASFFAARKIGNRGFLIGAVIGGVTFAVITVISLISDNGSVTLNTLFRFIIIMLSALIGGISGVNKVNTKKYI